MLQVKECRTSRATMIVAHDPFHPARNREVITIEGAPSIRLAVPVTKRPFVVFKNGEIKLRRDWDETVADGDQLLVAMLPQGDDGGSDILRIVLLIVVIYFAPYLGTGAAALFGGSAAGWTAAIGMMGAMLINVLLPPAQPSGLNLGGAADWKAGSPTYNLSAQGNQARIDGVIPEHFGRHIAYADFASAPYLEYEANEQYLYQLFCVGTGEYSIESVLIEDTPVASFEEITYEVVAPGEPVTLFPSDVITSVEVSGQELLKNNPVGPFVAGAAGTTATKISIDIVCPSGLFYAADSGALTSKTIVLEVTGQRINDLGEDISAPVLFGTIAETASTNTAQRRSYSYNVDPGRYKITVERMDEKDTSSRAGHMVQWVGLRSHLVTDNEYGNVTLVAMRMRATNNLSQQSSRKVNLIATRKLPVWTGTTWSDPTATRSIAWAIAYMCKKVGMPDNRIDLAGLLALDTIWAARGDQFNFRFDSQRTFWDSISLAAACGRAKMFMQGGVMYCWRDQPQTIPTAMFTMRNIIKNSFSMEFITPTEDTADSVEVTYFDESTWSTKRLLCKLPGSVAAKPAKIELPGVINRAHAYREGLYRAAANKYRRTITPFQCEMEGYMLSYGALATLQHDLPQWGQFGEAVAWDDINLRLTVNEPLTWEASGTHYIAIRRKNGSISGPYAVTAGADAYTVQFAVDPTVADVLLTWEFDGNGERNHIAFGVGSSWSARALIASIKPQTETKVSIIAVLEDDRVHEADTTSSPPTETTPITLPTVPTKPEIASLIVSQDGSPDAPVVTASWPASAGAESYRVEWSSNNTDWVLGGDTTATEVSFSVVPGTLYVRARAFGVAPGPWIVWSGVSGNVPVPGKPQGLALVEPWVGTKAKWVWLPAARAASYEIEIYADAALKRSFSTTALNYDYDHEQVIADGGPWRTVEINIRSVGPSGASAWSTLTSVNPQVGALSGVSVAPGYLQVIGKYSLPADTDFAGVIVAMSKTTGFDPNVSGTHAYDGYDQIFVLTSDPTAAAFVSGDVWYVRVAGYDVFGKDSLTWSAQQSVTIEGVDFSGPIDGTLILDDSIETPKFKANSVTAAKMSVSDLSAISANLGTITSAAIDLYSAPGGSGWGYARSYAKWWDDGNNGWILARNVSGETAFEVKAGTSRIWMHSTGDCGINFNNKFTLDASGNISIKSAASGARLEIANNVIKIFDSSGTLRVKIGDLTA